jgi:cyclase
MLIGAGGNIGMSVGRDGILLVDTGTEQMSDKLLATVQQLAYSVIAGPTPATTCVGPTCLGVFNQYGWSSPAFNSATVSRTPPKTIRYIINTSVDPDHTGGNAKIAVAGMTFVGGNITGAISDAGEGSAIVAHDNVLVAMSEANLPSRTLPTDTYHNESYKLSQFFNGEGVQIVHLPGAHSDGDSVVFFRYSDVLCAGDAYSNDRYPVFDPKKASIQGVIDGLNRILDIAIPEFRAQGGTMIIPGHGRLADYGDVAAYRNMVSVVRDRIQDLVKTGKTLEQVKAARPTLDYDGIYGSSSQFIETTYRSLTQKQ